MCCRGIGCDMTTVTALWVSKTINAAQHIVSDGYAPKRIEHVSLYGPTAALVT